VSQLTIGCLSFGATAQNREQVAALLLTLEADPFFVGPFVGSSTLITDPNGRDSVVVTFAGSTGLSNEALVTPLTPEEIAAITAPPAPAPSAEGGGAK
jgi:hypothetical protein